MNRKFSLDTSVYLIVKDLHLTSNEFEGLIIRLVTFHLQKTFLRYLRQFNEGCGLDSILTEVDIYGTNTLASFLKDTQYNRGIRLHKLTCEALRSIQSIEFIEYMEYSNGKIYK